MNEHDCGHIDDTTQLNQLYHTEKLYHSDEFESLLEKSGADLTDISDLEQILEFISTQCGDWFAHWACSPAKQPDLDAQAEFDNWELLWRAFAQCHFKEIPKKLDTVTRRHITQRDRRLMKYVKSPDQAASSGRFRMSFGYRISRYLRLTGLHRFADLIFSFSIYPKGSVGRG